ncbi:hypothetical protein ACLOJK_034190, partial [Asimina triloba]
LAGCTEETWPITLRRTSHCRICLSLGLLTMLESLIRADGFLAAGKFRFERKMLVDLDGDDPLVDVVADRCC